MSHPRQLQQLKRPRPRIAILRALQLGDLLCAMPAMRSLRQALPNAEITLIGLPWARDFVHRYAQYVDHFLEFPGWEGLPEVPFDPPRTRDFLAAQSATPFDLVIQMHGSGSFINDFARQLPARLHAGYVESSDLPGDFPIAVPYPHHLPEIHRHLRLMEALGGDGADDRLELPLFHDDERDLAAVPEFAELAGHEYVCIHPGARWPSRRWPAARFAAVADQLAQDGRPIVLTGSAAERELVADVRRRMRQPALDLSGRTSLGALGVLVRDASLVISNDTGMAHVAAAVRTPSVIAVLGSDSARWAPLDRQRHRVVLAAVDCRPCEHFVCPIGHPCAHELTVAAVLEAARKQLANFSPVGETLSSIKEDRLCVPSVC